MLNNKDLSMVLEARRILHKEFHFIGFCEVYHIVKDQTVTFFILLKNPINYLAKVIEIDLETKKVDTKRSFDIVSSIKNAEQRFKDRRTGKIPKGD